MVIIRLARAGGHKRPFYHVVVTDSRNKRDGKYIERIGYFNPIARGQEVQLNINLDRFEYWVGCGAQLSERIKKLAKIARENADKGVIVTGEAA